MWRKRLLLIASLLAALIVGVGIGLSLGFASDSSSNSPVTRDSTEMTPALDLPELQRSQTEQDRLADAEAVGVEDSSTRFIADADGFDVYLARALSNQGACLIIVRSDGAGVPTTACGDGDGVGVTVTPGLDIGIGDSRAAPMGGVAVRLSESVFAYRR